VIPASGSKGDEGFGPNYPFDAPEACSGQAFHLSPLTLEKSQFVVTGPRLTLGQVRELVRAL
jgi:hypothetical protein